ncbi:hypothetical protein [Thermococcus sp.]
MGLTEDLIAALGILTIIFILTIFMPSGLVVLRVAVLLLPVIIVGIRTYSLESELKKLRAELEEIKERLDDDLER